MNRKDALLCNLSCSHVRIIDKYDVSRTVKGTMVYCLECMKIRFIKERSWIDSSRVNQ